jgi:hypothetical protein
MKNDCLQELNSVAYLYDTIKLRACEAEPLVKNYKTEQTVAEAGEMV